MSFPDSPCAGCVALVMPCRAMRKKVARLCELVAAGDEGYIALVRDGRPPDVDADRAAILRRRAGKVRIALGSRPPRGRR